jgi:hypothetical protein
LIRRRRWRAIEGFATGIGVLIAISTWLIPTWPLQLLDMMVRAPVVTLTFPCMGTTWFLVLRCLGLDGWLGLGLYAVFAVPFAWALFRAALRPTSQLDEIVALSILAVFFVAPTARPYDQPILMIPVLVLLGTRVRGVLAAAVVLSLLVLPYVHLLLWIPTVDRMPAHVWFFWIPLLLSALWFGSPITGTRVEPLSSSGAQPATFEATA